MRKSYFMWLIVFFAFVFAAIIASGGDILWYLNIPAAIMIVGPALTLSLANFGFREIGASFRAAFDGGADRKTLDDALLFFEGLKRYFIGSGVIGAFTGAIAMLVSLSDRVTAGQGAALIVLTILYSALAYVSVAVPFATAIRKRIVSLN